MTLNTVAVAKLRKERLIRSKSEIPSPRPNPMIGPISGGDQHRTDNHRRRVRIQTQRGDKGRKDQNPKVRPFKLYAFPDRLDRFEFILFS